MTTETVVLPELGNLVELREGTVGDILPLAAQAGELSTADLMLRVLAASLFADGVRVTEDALRALPARRFRELMKLGPRALEINGFTSEAEDVTNPKS